MPEIRGLIERTVTPAAGGRGRRARQVLIPAGDPARAALEAHAPGADRIASIVRGRGRTSEPHTEADQVGGSTAVSVSTSRSSSPSPLVLSNATKVRSPATTSPHVQPS